MNGPLVSVVIPVYNGANYLAEAIDSVLAQTYPHREILVIDDGSTDDGATRAVATSYGDKVRYLHKPNGGVSSALNYGIAAMRGDWFAWLSHDDRFLPDKLEKQVNYLTSHPSVKILACGLEVIDNGGNVTSRYSSGTLVTIRNGRGVMDHWVYGCSLLIARTVFDSAGRFNESNRTVQDLEKWLEFVHRGFEIVMLPDVLCQWRYHEQSGSFTLRGTHFAEVDAFLRRIAASYPLDFFHAGSGELSSVDRQEIYGWFAGQSLRRGATRRAQSFYVKGLAASPNVFARRFWRLLRQYLQSRRREYQAQ